MDENDSFPAAQKLLEIIRKDKNLSHQLGLELSGPSSSKRNSNDCSPIRLKKVRLDQSRPSCSKQHTQTRSPDVNALDSGTSNVGAGFSNTEYDSSSGVDAEQVDPDDQDDLDRLEQIVSKSDPPSEVEEDSDSDEDEDLTVLGAVPEANWAPSKKLFEWYLKVSDLELSKEVISDITEEFKADEEINNHFLPPRFPLPLWSAVQSSSADAFKLKSIFRAQEHLLLAIKPLLTVAKNAPKEDKAHILKSIQLLTNSNLSLNRLRRCMLAPHLKPDLKKSLLAIPVKHNSFFGDDFSKVTDGLIKENSTVDKILLKKPQKNSNHPKNSNAWGSRKDNSNRNPFRGGGGRRRGYRGRGRGRNFAPNSQSHTDPSSSHSGGNPTSSQQ